MGVLLRGIGARGLLVLLWVVVERWGFRDGGGSRGMGGRI